MPLTKLMMRERKTQKGTSSTPSSFLFWKYIFFKLRKIYLGNPYACIFVHLFDNDECHVCHVVKKNIWTIPVVPSACLKSEYIL